MGTLLNYLSLPNNKGIIFWMKWYWNNVLINFYKNKEVSGKIDNTWKEKIKIKSTYKPAFYPKHPNNNNVTRYLELNNQNNSWKRI